MRRQEVPLKEQGHQPERGKCSSNVLNSSYLQDCQKTFRSIARGVRRDRSHTRRAKRSPVEGIQRHRHVFTADIDHGCFKKTCPRPLVFSVDLRGNLTRGSLHTAHEYNRLATMDLSCALHLQHMSFFSKVFFSFFRFPNCV